MPSREPELYKDKIEVSLDGRQIFYLFFGGAAIVGLVFVLGVMVGRRVEARGHLDRAQTQTASDPLAALDRLEHSDNLSFHGALTGSEPATDVEKAIGELEKRRAGGKPDKKSEPLSSPIVAGIDAHAEPITRPEADKPRAEKHDGEKKSKKHEDASGESRSEKSDAKRTEGKPDKPVTRPEGRDTKLEARADAKLETAKADAKPAVEGRRFTLQLSSFQDKSEAEAFLAATKSAGYQAYLTEADVSGKGTFYRVRLGSYRSLDAANDAKAEYEKAAKKTAQVMRL
jgi:cell division septation protein DedD